jgi:hypothetical protein
MAKRKLGDIAKDYGMTFEELLDLSSKRLDESMITGRGKLLWVSEAGQTVLDECIPMLKAKPSVYRGKVMHNAPNPRFIVVYLRELNSKVPVEIPLRMKGKLDGKMVYVERHGPEDNQRFRWVKTPSVLL